MREGGQGSVFSTRMDSAEKPAEEWVKVSVSRSMMAVSAAGFCTACCCVELVVEATADHFSPFLA